MPYQLNDVVRLPVRFRRADTGALFAPSGTPTITVTSPNGSEATHSATRLGTSFTYYYDLTASSAGEYAWYGATDDAAAANGGQTSTGCVEVGQAWIEHLDADLSAIEAKTNLITANNFSVVSSVDPASGDLTIVRGDDYTVASGRALPEWSSDDWTAFDLTTATSITLRARTRYSAALFTKAAAALSDTQVRIELTTEETSAFDVGREAYSFDLQAVLASGAIVTLAQGKIHVRGDVR